MKKNFKTSGIVLRRINFGEADQIITLLTKSDGKFSFLVKGSRKMGSRFCGKLELMNEINLEGYEGRNLHYLKEVEVIHYLKDTDLKTKSVLFFMSEAVCKLAPEGQQIEEVYSLLRDSIQKITNHQNKSEQVLYAFMIKLLTGLGFMAAWDQCMDSRQKLDLEKPIYLNDEGCPTHQFSGFFKTLNSPLIKWVNFMQKNPLEDVLRVNPNSEIQNEAWLILSDHLKKLLSSPLKSEIFLGKI